MLIFLAITIIPLALLQFLSGYWGFTGLSARIQEGLVQEVDGETRFIEAWTGERIQNIKTLASLEPVRLLDVQQAHDILVQNQQMWGTFEWLSIFTPDGESLVNTTDQPLNAKDRDYFKQALNGKDAVSDPLVSKRTGNVVVIFATPIQSEGKVVGVLSGTMGVTAISEILGDMELGETGDAYLINHAGQVVTPLRHEPELIRMGIITDTAVLQHTVDTFASAQVLAGESGSGVYQDIRGKQVIGAYREIPSLGLGLIVEQEEAEALTEVRQTTLYSAAISLATVLVLILAIVFVTRSISRPIAKMAGIADQLAEGKIQQQVLENRKDEVGALAKAFQRMIAYQGEMADTARQIANGNLAVAIQPKSEQDELSLAFVHMASRLGDMIHGIAENAVNLSSASMNLAEAADQADRATNQISATIQQISRGTSQQAESITRTAGSVEQMSRAIGGVAQGAHEQATATAKASHVTAQISTAIQQVAESAQMQASGAAEAAQSTQTTAQTIQETVRGMESIKARVGLSAQKVQEMGQRSNQIGMIVETIDDIASQTNLLALNAAIEAARAGEHGKGFAVVADEVRKLAEKSAAATKEIAVLVKGIQGTVEQAVQAMNESAVEVENGVALANQSGQSLAGLLVAAEGGRRSGEDIAASAERMSVLANELVEAMDSVSAVVEENTASTEEMAAGSSEVTQAIENIASVSEENSAAVEEVSASAEEMNAQVQEVTAAAQSLAHMADTLNQVVAQFNLTTQPNQKQAERPNLPLAKTDGPAPHPAQVAKNGHHPVREIQKVI
jgi:methyl-accepting chemotaxis protein